MVTRHRAPKTFADADRKRLLDALRICRAACIDANRAMPISYEPNAPYKASQDFLRQIDDLVGVLTGNRDLFHDQPHGLHQSAAPPGTCQICSDHRWTCEYHGSEPWPHAGCIGAGRPCHLCNRGNPPDPGPDFESLARVEDDDE